MQGCEHDKLQYVTEMSQGHVKHSGQTSRMQVVCLAYSCDSWKLGWVRKCPPGQKPSQVDKVEAQNFLCMMPSEQLSLAAAVFLCCTETCHFCMSAAALTNSSCSGSPSADWSWYLHVAILHLADPAELSRCGNLSATLRTPRPPSPPHLAYVPR